MEDADTATAPVNAFSPTAYKDHSEKRIGQPMWTYVLPRWGSRLRRPGLGLRPNSGGFSL